MKTFDGREKSLLRAAVTDLVPDSILQRRKSPYPATQDPAYDQALRDELRRIVSDDGAPVLPLLDRPAVQRAATAPVATTTSTVTRFMLEMVLDLNAWLAAYAPRLDL